MTRRNEELVGTESVATHTGQPREAWFDLLDDAGATAWGHPRIAAWLVEEHGVDGWWAQGLTVSYEQARGMREPGQRADGTFEASASKTIPGDVAGVFRQLAAAELRAAWLDGDWRQTGVTDGKTVRLAAEDGSRVLLSLTPVTEQKVRVAAAHSKLPDAEALAAAKAFWRAALTRLAANLTPTHPADS